MTFVSGEVKNPQRNIPLALCIGMIVCTMLYVFVNSTYFYVLTPIEVASVPAIHRSRALSSSDFSATLR